MNEPIIDVKFYKDQKALVFTISRRALELDVKYGILGEYIAEVLLLPLEYIKNYEYLHDLVTKYRQRIVLEVSRDLISHFKTRGLAKLLDYILIPPEYFVLKKMSDRIYSYPMLGSMYRSICSAELLSRLRSEYRPVLLALAERGFVYEWNGYFILRQGAFGRSYGEVLRTKILGSLFSVPGIATKILKELPKLNLSIIKEIYSGSEAAIPPCLDMPESMLKLMYGELYVTTPSTIRHSKYIGKLGTLSTSELRIVKTERGEEYVVVKKFATFMSTKWLAASIIGIPATHVITNPGQRLANEYVFTIKLSNMGFCVPKIKAVILDNYMVVKEYLGGISLSKIVDRVLEDPTVRGKFIELGRLIASIHNNGISIGDSKLSNFVLVKDSQICIVDLEQMRYGSIREKAWDIAEAIYFLALEKQFKDQGTIIECAKLIIQGYASKGDLQVLREASKPRYLAPFAGFLNPQLTWKLNNVIKKGYQEVPTSSDFRAGYT